MCPPDTPIHRSNLLCNTPCRLPQWSDKNKRRRNQAVEGVGKGRTKPESVNTCGIKPEKACSGGIESEKGGVMSVSNKRRYVPQVDGTPCPEPT